MSFKTNTITKNKHRLAYLFIGIFLFGKVDLSEIQSCAPWSKMDAPTKVPPMLRHVEGKKEKNLNKLMDIL